MKRFLIFFVVLFFTFFSRQAYAQSSNFQTGFTGVYAIKSSGITHASFSVSLKNLTDKFYATSYSLQLGFSDVKNIVASDQEGTISPKLKKTPDGQELTFAFNHRAIGLGATQTFTFSFDTSNVATKNGSIWEVNIPGLKNQNDFGDFKVSIVVPPEFGSPVYMKPDVGSTLYFTKDQLGKSGISLAFGQKQVFHFNVAYHLKNTQVFPVHTEIALPPDTTYQTVSIDSLSPKPLNVTQDADGNWLAQYSLLPSQVLTVHADGRAFLSLFPKKQSITSQQMKTYQTPAKYWQTTNASIMSLAKELKTPYAIYEYVVKTLHYDYSRVSDNQDRLGAAAVLQNPKSAVCLEFTDLFIAIARAAGIPAREVDGFAYTQNSRERPLSLEKDILHAWPEYYDTQLGTWVMVDPTWENTTGGVDYFRLFDFDHITFVIKGNNPEYPIPAGGYKLPGQEKNQDVLVDFAVDTLEPAATSTLDFLVPKNSVSGFAITATVGINNSSSVLFPPQVLQTSSTLSSSTQNIDTSAIPPYGKISIPVILGKTPFLTNKTGTATILLAGTQVSRNITVVPLSLTMGIIAGGIIIGIFTVIVLIITRRPRSVPILYKK